MIHYYPGTVEARHETVSWARLLEPFRDRGYSGLSRLRPTACSQPCNNKSPRKLWTHVDTHLSDQSNPIGHCDQTWTTYTMRGPTRTGGGFNLNPFGRILHPPSYNIYNGLFWLDCLGSRANGPERMSICGSAGSSLLVTIGSEIGGQPASARTSKIR